jgi:pyruvate dehydrogenase E1 component alpha subunit
MKGKDSIAVAYLGEGAANQGAFHEALNLAALWKLGAIFVIEDNAWGISVSKKKSTAVADNSVRAAAYGIPGFRVGTMIRQDVQGCRRGSRARPR